MSQDLELKSGRLLAATRMLWIGIAVSVGALLIDVVLTTVWLDATFEVPVLLNAIVNRVIALLTILGPAMIAAALALKIAESRNK